MSSRHGKSSLEDTATKRRRRTSIENILLGTLTAAGAVTFAVMAPNALAVLKHIDTDWLSKRDPRQRLHESMSRMRRKGLVRFDERTRRYRLTDTGTQMARRIQNGTVRIAIPKRWDGRWRIVMFDINEQQRSLRRKIVSLVSSLGFYRLQDSVWIHPYDCEEIVAFLKTDLQVGKELLYVIADAVEYDKPLREHFRLPLR